MKKFLLDLAFYVSSGLTITDIIKRFVDSIPLLSSVLQLSAATIAVITGYFVLKNTIYKNKLLKKELKEKDYLEKIIYKNKLKK